MEDYKVIRAIGKGSFGKVYLVRHNAEARQYVMKVIKLKGIPQKERRVVCSNGLCAHFRFGAPPPSKILRGSEQQDMSFRILLNLARNVRRERYRGAGAAA